MYTISEINGVKIYNLSAGKTLPQFLEESSKKQKSLKYDQEFRRRIELIQDFDFPIASTQVKVSPDQNYIIASGVYPPQVKIYETAELSMKCLRGLDSQVIDFEILGDDYTKLVFACADRALEFHAQYGKHYRTRIPKMPRDMIYNQFSCDLIVAGSGNDIYRMSLDEGRFLSSLTSDSTSMNTLFHNQNLNVLMCGSGKNTNDGLIEIWDYREKEKIGMIKGGGVTYLTGNDENPMQYAVGSYNGNVSIYDYRYPKPILSIQHQYREPINSIIFHNKTKNILSSNKKALKINNLISGNLFTSIEPKEEINSFELVKNSGLLLVACENIRIGTYFIPALDSAPKWCHYIENVTEELEEEMVNKIYDEFKFLSLEDLEKLNANSLIGSNMLKPYMHGYLMHYKLYQKLENINDPFAYEKYRKDIVNKKLEEKRKNRIVLQKKEKKNVNEQFVKELERKQTKKNIDYGKEIVESDRFGVMFKDDRFKIDEKSEEYLRNNPQRNKKLFANYEENEEEVIQTNDVQNKKTFIKKKSIMKKNGKNDKFKIKKKK